MTNDKTSSPGSTRNLPCLPSTPHYLEHAETDKLKPNARNARTHSKKQIKQIAESIRNFGFNNPILIDNAFGVIAGHGRLQAAKLLGLTDVPVVCLSHLSDAEKRAYILADNKIALDAGWDSELLALEFDELTDLLPDINLDLEVTGFEMGEIDILLSDHEPPASAGCDEDNVPAVRDTIVTQRGDIWQLGYHRIRCGDARDDHAMSELLDNKLASLVLTDPPYNVKVQGHVGGRGRTKHSEFAFASGEMSDQEFKIFLNAGMSNMLTHLAGGALLYLFMDWRHIEILLSVGRELELTLKNICVWNKTTPGQGSFYRSAHELVAVFANPGGTSTNNVQLGRFGRNRSNVWTYPGVNTFKTGEGDDLSLHPTVKPVTMISEAIKDASGRGEIVLDPFLGSGTTLLAADKVGRRCYGIEYEPGYVDITIRRWQHLTGKDAVLCQRYSGVSENDGDVSKTFDELSQNTSSAEKS
ncbi:MAG: site-specific DNA-methyltransferase [Rhizobiaceae bacterium]|nr:site-specific DNA-methyltransferase [Rhizobiaceae bacterium]